MCTGIVGYSGLVTSSQMLEISFQIAAKSTMVDVMQMLFAHMKLKQMQLYVIAKPGIQIQVQIRQLCVLVRSNLRKTYLQP